MKAKSVLGKISWGKSLILIGSACFLLTALPLSAQDYNNQGGYGGESQQNQQDYQYQQQQQQGQQQMPETDFNDADIEKFAEAQGEVDEIRAEFSKELEQVEDMDKARALQDKYSQQMVEAIDGTGLSVRKYNEISMAMQNDPELRGKVEELTR